MSVVERTARFLGSHLSRRNFLVRSAFAGSALSVAGVRYLLEPGTAYAAVCVCGSSSCSCGTTCCSGYTEFCCVMTGRNMCPTGTIMGGWWMAEGSRYCSGPRYYMDCNATCHCTTGCADGYQFCDTSCDGLTCECADGSCGNYLTGCFQFRYGQCNQDVTCMGRIQCRVVSCVSPWSIDPSCTTATATDNNTANQNSPCLQAPIEEDDMPTAMFGQVPTDGSPLVIAIPPPNGGGANWGPGWFSMGCDFANTTVRVAVHNGSSWRYIQNIALTPAGGRVGIPLQTGDDKISIAMQSPLGGPTGWLIEYGQALA